MRARWTRVRRLARVGAQAARALASRRHPVLAQVVTVRRCNLACSYCSEYDSSSAPVPAAVLLRRIERLADLGTAVVTLTGGEPLLHPQIESVVARGRRRGMIVTMISNGSLLSRDRIRALNAAGLDYLQISIDNVEPDEASKKSLRLLEPKLRWLSEDAEFQVNVNTVLGPPVREPEDALVVARRARELGFSSSVGILHDGSGQLRRLDHRSLEVYRELRAMGIDGGTHVNALFQDNLALGIPNRWSCRAGARFLYVDESGLVHYCSQRRGRPGLPLEGYARADLDREYAAPKGCAPYCTLSCALQVGLVDRWRRPHPAGAAPGYLPLRPRAGRT